MNTNDKDWFKKIYKFDSLVDGLRHLIDSRPEKKEPPKDERIRKYKHYFYQPPQTKNS